MSRISLRALTALLTVLALAAVPAVATAHSSSGKTKKHRKHSRRATKADRNADGLPDTWEKKFGLSLKVDQSGRDQDRDGLTNAQEFKVGTSPCDKDTDDDGVSDKNEQAGTVASFDTATQILTINLAAGGTATGKVTADTEFRCRVAAPTPTTPTTTATTASRGSDDGEGHDVGDDTPQTTTPPATGTTTPVPTHSENEGDDDHGDHHGGQGSPVPCGVAQLTAGTVVHEAEIKLTKDGPIIDEIKLVLPAPTTPATPTT